MPISIKLTNIKRGKTYKVPGFNQSLSDYTCQETDFAQSTSDYAAKLYKMGFIEGTPIELASVNISDPIVIQIRGSRVALRKNEAQQILVTE
ncbi:FeoA family protein [Desulfotalea psychrophila]|uniref:Related to ferrous ion transport protein A n=1 Tax=Desulfotalea psychrophila (strain LSv54 / DSM 12343) TaxID=177439 RepID=Q6APN6_DESPS|nr:FeoA family protein [Desulfotalea psychrophila]CAG35688.1 related to ferrous ion transport protein A [Desulfotalea psychrophila LSv54]